MTTRPLPGTVVLATPHPVTHAELVRAVRRHLGGPGERVGVPTPAWALHLDGALQALSATTPRGLLPVRLG